MHIKRFATFVSIGIFDTLLDTGLFTFFIYLFGRSVSNIIIFNIISFSFVVVCAFFLNGKLTFKDKHLTGKKFVKYYSTSSVGMFFNTLIVTFLMINLGLGTIVSKILAACVIVFYNYTMCKKVVFDVKS